MGNEICEKCARPIWNGNPTDDYCRCTRIISNNPKEFYLSGEPNEYDVGIWYDHEPDRHVVNGAQCWEHHVIEYSAYEQAIKERDDLRAILHAPANLAVKLLIEERDELKRQCQFTSSNWPHEKKMHKTLEVECAKATKLIEALWKIKAQGNGTGTFMVANEALAEYKDKP